MTTRGASFLPRLCRCCHPLQRRLGRRQVARGLTVQLNRPSDVTVGRSQSIALSHRQNSPSSRAFNTKSNHVRNSAWQPSGRAIVGRVRRGPLNFDRREMPFHERLDAAPAGEFLRCSLTERYLQSQETTKRVDGLLPQPAFLVGT